MILFPKSNNQDLIPFFSSCFDRARNVSFLAEIEVRLETEVKIRLNDVATLRRGLTGMHTRIVAERHFEDNYVLDFPDGRMRSGHSMLRLRHCVAGSLVTFKGRPRPDNLFKIREELETAVGDAAVALRIFESLGLQVWFRYQKYREEFEFQVSGGGFLYIALDETPIGSYAEFEGAREDIRSAAETLGFSSSDFLRDSYYWLYVLSCRERGVAPGNMLFPGAASGL